MITNIKIKGVSRCANYLAVESIVDRIKDQYELNYFLEQKMLTYCVKCKENTENLNPEIFKTKKGRLIMQSKCAECGIKIIKICERTKSKGVIK